MNRRKLLGLLPASIFGFSLHAKAGAPSKFDRLLLVGLDVPRELKHPSGGDATTVSCALGIADYCVVYGTSDADRHVCEELGSFRTPQEAEKGAREIQRDHENIPLEIWREQGYLGLGSGVGWEQMTCQERYEGSRRVSKPGPEPKSVPFVPRAQERDILGALDAIAKVNHESPRWAYELWKNRYEEAITCGVSFWYRRGVRTACPKCKHVAIQVEPELGIEA